MPQPNSQPDSAEIIRRRIRDAGLRATAARVAVLQELLAATSPVTHAQMAERLAGGGHDRATIYRNLVEMAEAGILSRIELGDHVWRFELRRLEEAGVADHPHFVCVDCGEVSCLPTGSVSIQHDAGAKPATIGTVTAVLLKGHCNHCG
jgi:Fur family ferric uptake transcriptional regulator